MASTLALPTLDVAQLAADYGVALTSSEQQQQQQPDRSGFGMDAVRQENARRMKEFAQRRLSEMNRAALAGEESGVAERGNDYNVDHGENPQVAAARSGLDWAMSSISGLRVISADDVEQSVWAHLMSNPRVVFIDCKLVIAPNAGTKATSGPLTASLVDLDNAAMTSDFPRAFVAAVNARMNGVTIDVDDFLKKEKVAAATGLHSWSLGQVAITAWNGFDSVETVLRLAALPSNYRDKCGRCVIPAGKNNASSTVRFMYTHPDLVDAEHTMYHKSASRFEKTLQELLEGCVMSTYPDARIKGVDTEEDDDDGEDGDEESSDNRADDDDDDDDDAAAKARQRELEQAAADPFNALPETDNYAPDQWVDLAMSKSTDLLSSEVAAAPSPERWILALIDAQPEAIMRKGGNVVLKIPSQADQMIASERLRRAVAELNAARESVEMLRNKKNKTKKDAALLKLTQKRNAAQEAMDALVKLQLKRNQWSYVLRSFLHIAANANVVKVELPTEAYLADKGKEKIVAEMWDTFVSILGTSQNQAPVLATQSAPSTIAAGAVVSLSPAALVVEIPNTGATVDAYTNKVPALQASSVSDLLTMYAYPATVSDRMGLQAPGSKTWKPWLTGINPLSANIEDKQRCFVTFTVALIPNY